VSDVCIPPENLNLDGRRREETPDPRFKELRELLDETENSSFEEVTETIEELMDFLEIIDVFEALKLQDVICARRFMILKEQYDVNRTIEKVCDIMERGCVKYKCLTEEEVKQFVTENSNREVVLLSEEQTLITLKKYYQTLLKYFKETKRIGLGLPDNASMRTAGVLLSLKVHLERMGMEIA
jgi:hypothetical protein